MAEKGKKRRKLPRRGLLAESSRMLRLMVAAVILVACAALAFTQLGFVGIGMPDDYVAYAMVMLLPVTLAALLLGALRGMAMGAAAGALLFVHASFMPLDYYEFTYVTPFSSICLLALSGLLIGFLFSFALRNDPKGPKRYLYMGIVCILVSWLYSFGFVVNAFVATVNDIALAGYATASQQEANAIISSKAASMVLRMGDVGVQAWVDALLMTVCSCLASFAVARARARAGEMTLYALFGTWLLVVVFVTFMVTAGIIFVSITQGEQAKTAESIRSEVGYLGTQVNNREKRFEALGEFLENTGVAEEGLTEEGWSALLDAVSMNNLLSGYSKEDNGIILIARSGGGQDASGVADSVVLMSDDDGIAVGSKFSECFDRDMLAAISRSLENDEVVRAVYDEYHVTDIESLNETAGEAVGSYVVFLYCKNQDELLIVDMVPASKAFADRTVAMIWTSLIAFILLLAVFLMVFQLLRRMVIDRIEKTNGVLGRITSGDLEARVDERVTKEFSSLSDGINATVDALRGWISEAETRMDAELSTAKAIQESALPRTFPPYPDIAKFDVYASMKPAREVGGDFYDFFLIGNDCNANAGKLGFVMADVSGKGVPAALFMMKSMTQVRDYLQSGMEVGEAIENANRQLVDGNDAGMFVTAWVGVLDYATGHIDFVNAGHNPPLVWQCDTGWRWLTEKSGLPLGLFADFPYEAYSLECGIGDQLLLYTDGVTEGMNVDGELYGEDRLKSFADANFTLHPRMLIEALRKDLAAFTDGAEQSDDITMLALEVGVPPEITAVLTVPADVDELPNVYGFIHGELDKRLCPKRVQNQIDIAVEELFVNVAHYAYPDATPENPGTVRVGYSYSAEPPSMSVSIMDEGVPYNPLDKPDAVTPDDIADVPIGGLGILMAKRCVDEMTYERVDGSNIVTIEKKW